MIVSLLHHKKFITYVSPLKSFYKALELVRADIFKDRTAGTRYIQLVNYNRPGNYNLKTQARPA